MNTDLDPQAFARVWMTAWNDHDIEAVLSHFRDDAVFTSPLARRLGHGADGVVTGKAAIRNYWTEALKLSPSLRFETQAVYAGANMLVITFKTQDEVERAEVLIFEDGLVTNGYGTAITQT